jgi:hypothetical protein
VLALRVYLLQGTVELPYSEAYGGCKSWIELEQPVPVAGARPVLEDDAFDGLVSPALEALRGLEPAQVDS